MGNNISTGAPCFSFLSSVFCEVLAYLSKVQQRGRASSLWFEIITSLSAKSIFKKNLSATFKRKYTFRAVFVSQENCRESHSVPVPLPHIHSLLNHDLPISGASAAMMNLDLQYNPEPRADIRAYSWCCVFCGLWKIYNDMYPPSLYHKEQLHCPQILCAPHSSPLTTPKALAAMVILNVSIVLPFPEGPVVGVRRHLSAFGTFTLWYALQGVSQTNSSFLLCAEENLIVWMHTAHLLGSPTPPREDNLVASKLWRLWIELPRATWCRRAYGPVSSASWQMPVSAVAGLFGKSVCSFVRNGPQGFQMAMYFAFP